MELRPIEVAERIMLVGSTAFLTRTGRIEDFGCLDMADCCLLPGLRLVTVSRGKI